jgi:hypothetical protein
MRGTLRPFVVLCVVSLVTAALPGSAAAATPSISSSIDGIAGNNNWWRGSTHGNNVVLYWSVTAIPSLTNTTGCDPAISIPGPTTGVTKTCTATNDDGTSSSSITIKIDADPPTGVGAAPARAPDANGWYNHLVGLNWSGTDATSKIASCTSSSYSGPDSATASVPGSCQDMAGNVTSASFVLKYDSTPPSVHAGAPGRAPDSNGWYAHPVTVTWSGTDATSGWGGCTTATYSGPDSASATVTGGICHDQAGNTAAAPGFTLKYDATPPHITGAILSRPPDANGWYTHPVTITWTGTDALSGIASCTSAAYSGQASAQATAVGSCLDRAGNLASTSMTLKYDGTAPTLANVRVASRARSDLVRWSSTSTDDRIVVKRWPRGSKDGQVVFEGRGSRFVDTKIESGIEYRYAIQSTDEAGNASKTATAVGLPKVLTLRRMSYVPRAAPKPILRWRSLRGASYYHVQLFRGSKRVLAAWPSKRQLGLPKRWRWAGRRYTLSPGRYRWFVWGGLGRRALARYRAIGSARFIIPSR